MLDADSGTLSRVASSRLPTKHGLFQMHVYAANDGKEHIALTVGSVNEDAPVLVRIHSECLTGDVFGSYRCDCGEQLEHMLGLMQAEGRGVLIYLRQEGRGIGLTNKIRAYALQEAGLDTVDANRALGLPDDTRSYHAAAAILRDLGVSAVELVTNNPLKISGLEIHGIRVVARKPSVVIPNSHNGSYLATKQTRMGHLL